MRRFVIGDIHGAFKALDQCLDRSGFDYHNDLLISLGDICDGWPETSQCIDELLKINNLIIILGNHDQWALEWMTTGVTPEGWLMQGGIQTMQSYKREVPESHKQLLQDAKLHHLTKNNKLFIHAGIDINKDLDEQDAHTLLWGRDFYNMVMNRKEQSRNFTNFSEVYIGHSPIHRKGFFEPLKIGEVWLMDTGASWDGVLSMMDIDTKEVFTSDKPADMYPPGSGRL